MTYLLYPPSERIISLSWCNIVCVCMFRHHIVNISVVIRRRRQHCRAWWNWYTLTDVVVTVVGLPGD